MSILVTTAHRANAYLQRWEHARPRCASSNCRAALSLFIFLPASVAPAAASSADIIPHILPLLLADEPTHERRDEKKKNIRLQHGRMERPVAASDGDGVHDLVRLGRGGPAGLRAAVRRGQAGLLGRVLVSVH